MKISEQRMNELLPPNILESELDLATKKVLAALCDWYLNSKARETKVVTIGNNKLASIAGVGGNPLQEAIRQLQDYCLVDRIKGTGIGNASQYIIHFSQMMKPLRRKTFAELFAQELEESESLEKPISITVQNSILQYSSLNDISEEGISEQSIPSQSISEKVIPDKSSLDEFISEEDSLEETGLDKDLFGTDTYLNDGKIVKELNTLKDKIVNSKSIEELNKDFDVVREIFMKMTNNGTVQVENTELLALVKDIIDTKVEKEKELDGQGTMSIQELEKEMEEGVTESMTKHEEETKETRCESQSLNQSEANQDSVFDPTPSQDNQKKPMLSVRAATRLWAEELEAKYQTRERTLQNLAMEDHTGFEKYVNYLRVQKRPSFQHHQELIHHLARFWEIDVDLDQD